RWPRDWSSDVCSSDLTIEADQRRIEFAPTARFPDDGSIATQDVHAVDTEQSNTTVLVGADYVIKLFRRLERGLNPEIELGRFLRSEEHTSELQSRGHL